MIKDKIGGIFDFIQETNIIEQYCYEHKGIFPVYSGQTENDGVVAYIDSFNQNEPCLIFTTYGSAGKLNYREGNFTIGRNAMGLRLKQKYKKDINLKWFSYKFQNLFYRLRIGDPQGQKSLNKLLLNNIVINIPDIQTQIKELSYYENVINLQNEIIKIKTELESLLKTKQLIKKYTYKELIENIFDFSGGNSGLTKEFIYYNQPTNDEEKISILSGATIENNLFGVVSINSTPDNNKLKIFSAPFIQIIRKGLAGQMKFFSDKKFVSNDDIYILTVKDEWENNINLRWFSYQYQELFYNLVTSKSDNATFNKAYAEKQLIVIPDISFQNKVANNLLEIDNLITEIKIIYEQLNTLIMCEIIN